MIKTLYQIGRLYADRQEYAQYFKPWQNPFVKAEGATVIVADVVNRKLVTPFRPAEEFRDAYLEKYLYRDPSGPRGANMTPSVKFYNVRKAEERKGNLEKFYDRLRRTLEDNKSLTEPFVDLKDFWEVFKPSFEAAIAQVEQEGNLLLTFRFDGKYPGEIDAFRRLLFDNAYDKYKQTNKAQFIGHNQVCAVTQQSADEVWGKIDTLGFTVDDEAFIRGGFDASEAWRMFPVSKDIVPILEGARELIFSKFKFNFFKMNYLIVPRFVGWADDDIRMVVQKLMDKASQKLESQSKAIINTETLIADIVEDEQFLKAGVTFDFFFFQQKQAQLSIKLHLVDIMPSRLGLINREKESMEKRFRPLLRKEIPAKGKKEGYAIEYYLSFKNIKDYFSDTVFSTKDVIFHPVFFKILEAVFYGQYLSEEVILKAFFEKLVLAFKNYDADPYKFEQHGYQTFAIYQYFIQLGLFQNCKPRQHMENTTIALTLDGFIAEHPDFFDEPQKKAAFVAGCLVERLLDRQRNKIKSEPFRKYLFNLSLDTEKLRKIMVKWEEKVSEYVRAGYIYEGERQIWALEQAEVLPHLLTPSLKKTELSYAFTMGMVMEKVFKRSKPKRESNNDIQ